MLKISLAIRDVVLDNAEEKMLKCKIGKRRARLRATGISLAGAR